MNQTKDKIRMKDGFKYWGFLEIFHKNILEVMFH
jgi:hypothetical protein